ncbi:MAG: hypothetical protein P1U89_26255 [Verrucomicrobiales bacterium]|nr:hypothetical protein [Verrucomicrobiales bacterium]
MSFDTILAFLAILGLSFTGRYLFRIGTYNVFACSALVVVGVLYFASITGTLLIGWWLVVVLSFALTAFAIIANKSGDGKRNFVLLGGIVTTLAVGLVLITRKFEFQSWDEFSHWARMSKFLILRSQLPEDAEVIILPSYPPAVNLWHYFLGNRTFFDEGLCLVAHLLIEVALVISILGERHFPGRSFFEPIGLAIGVIGLKVLAGLPVFSIYLEGFLAEMFVAGLVAGSRGKLPGKSVVLVFLIVFVLPISKAVGTMLAAFIVINFVIQSWFVIEVKAERIMKIVQALALISVMAISHFSWSMHLSQINSPLIFQSRGGIGQFLELILYGKGTDLELATVHNFLTAISGRFGLVFLFLATCLLGLNSLIIVRRRKEWMIALSVLLVGVVVYVVGLLYLYVYAFGSYEGPRLASLSRYMSVMVWACLLFGLAMLIDGVRGGGRRRGDFPKPTIIAVSAGIVILLSVLFTLKFWKAVPSQVSVLSGRPSTLKTMEVEFDKAIHKLQLGAKVYFICQGSNGLENVFFDYKLSGKAAKLSGWGWSLGDGPLFEGDVWTVKITKEQFVQKIHDENFDFVYLMKSDDLFVRKYGDVFDSAGDGLPDFTLFKVVSLNDSVEFVPVEL